ncbi:amidohydrolase [Lysinibacillus composti]|uniref:Amidohydrolase n=1 Tax=Lysinibacillus composti TaxID=720633 RepID=A0A3N9UAZ4_9BACI|nr:amidohydrolase [Lysinibacillus composti]MBM7609803.1 amidohydrolase [Lysinibacillus composti]RQW73577.1 amidohydrolase [Lysinibacillus composti]
MNIVLKDINEDLKKEAISLRRHFHANPELSGEEWETCKFIKQYLVDLNFEILPYNEPNIIAKMKGNGDGPTIAFRADIDALPIEEENDLTYKSNRKNISHMCGHDGHMAILLTVAKWCAENKEKIKPNILFIFQSSEEMAPSGAENLVTQGIIKEMDVLFGLHIWQPIEKGKIGINSGNVMASVDDFCIEINGVGGHGAMPQEAVDPIYIASHIIGAVHSINSRIVDPLEAAVITIGKLDAGTSYNIIPSKVRLYGSIRSLNEQTRQRIKHELKNMIPNICSAFQANGNIDIFSGLPALVNDVEITNKVKEIVQRNLPNLDIIEPRPYMASDDFSFYADKVKSCYLFVGMQGEISQFPHHHPKFQVDDSVLEIGISTFIKIIQNYY